MVSSVTSSRFSPRPVAAGKAPGRRSAKKSAAPPRTAAASSAGTSHARRAERGVAAGAAAAGWLRARAFFFERAVALDPRNAEARLDLAAALGKSGRSAEAIPHFEKAIEAGGRTTAALNGLGVARLETGDPQGAARAFRDSLALDPRQPGIADLLRKVVGGPR